MPRIVNIERDGARENVSGIDDPIYMNDNADANVLFNLPPAREGRTCRFLCVDPFGMRVSARGNDTIRVLHKTTSQGGYVQTATVGSVLELIAISSTEWITDRILGRWTDGVFTYDDRGLISP